MYRTEAAQEMIDLLVTQEVMYRDRASRVTDPFESGLYQGYIDATRIYLENAERLFAAIEDQARLLPEVDEPFASLRERLIAEEMAGDLRDFPADFAA